MHKEKEGAEYFTAKNYSKVFFALLNATYLNKENSEKALELLSNTDFTQGIVAGVPNNIKVAHKFGIYFFQLFDIRTS